MTRNGIGFSGFVKRLFVGGLLEAAVALLYATRSVTGVRGESSQESVRLQRQYRPLFTTSVEKTVETERRVNPTIGWLVVFYVASAVAMVSRLKMKKT